MKNQLFNIVFIIALFTATIQAQESAINEENQGTFTLNIVNLASNSGKVMVAIFNSEKNYSETGIRFKANTLEINDLKAEWKIEDIPFGEYAIKLYHDENENGKMDRNMLGIPSEDYAFSNNASGSFGPADYEDAKFIFNEAGLVHEINMD